LPRSWKYDIRSDSNEAIDPSSRFGLLDIPSNVTSLTSDSIVSNDDSGISYLSFSSSSLSISSHSSSSSKSRRSCFLNNLILSSNVCEVLIGVSTWLSFFGMLLSLTAFFSSRKLTLSDLKSSLSSSSSSSFSLSLLNSPVRNGLNLRSFSVVSLSSSKVFSRARCTYGSFSSRLKSSSSSSVDFHSCPENSRSFTSTSSLSLVFIKSGRVLRSSSVCFGSSMLMISPSSFSNEGCNDEIKAALPSSFFRSSTSGRDIFHSESSTFLEESWSDDISLYKLSTSLSGFSGGFDNVEADTLSYSCLDVLRLPRSWKYDIRSDSNEAIDPSSRFGLLDIPSNVTSLTSDSIVSNDDSGISYLSFSSSSLSISSHSSSSSKSRRSCFLNNLILSSNVCEVLIGVSTWLSFFGMLLSLTAFFSSRKLTLSDLKSSLSSSSSSSFSLSLLNSPVRNGLNLRSFSVVSLSSSKVFSRARCTYGSFSSRLKSSSSSSVDFHSCPENSRSFTSTSSLSLVFIKSGRVLRSSSVCFGSSMLMISPSSFSNEGCNDEIKAALPSSFFRSSTSGRDIFHSESLSSFDKGVYANCTNAGADFAFPRNPAGRRMREDDTKAWAK